MIQMDVPMAFGIGGLFASAAHKQLQRRDPAEDTRVQLHGNLYFVFVFCWPPVYLLERWFGWETAHVWWHGDTTSAHPWLIPAFIVSAAAALNVGFVFGRSLVRAGLVGMCRITSAAAIVASFAWMAAMGDRVLRLGTYRDWQAGVAPPTASDPTFAPTIAAILTWIFGVLIAWLLWLRRDGRRFHLTPNHHRTAQDSKRSR
jgi:hypothetical protein